MAHHLGRCDNSDGRCRHFAARARDRQGADRLKIVERPSPNFNERQGGGPVDILVLHYTGMPDAESAMKLLTSAEAKVSSHYTVDEDGTVYAHVPENLRAWHAGVSSWGGATDINSRSIGIEI